MSYYYADDPNYAAIKIQVSFLSSMHLRVGFSNIPNTIPLQTSKVTDHIHKVFEEILNNATWMDPLTKERALNKTALMKKYVAFPASIRGKDDLDEYYKGVSGQQSRYLLAIETESSSNFTARNHRRLFGIDFTEYRQRSD